MPIIIPPATPASAFTKAEQIINRAYTLLGIKDAGQAIDDTISKAPLAGGVQITDERYAELLNGMCSGLLVRIENGEAILQAPPKPEPIENDEPEA